MVVQDSDELGGDGDGPPAGVGLWRTEDPAPPDDDLGLLLDSDRPVDEVDVVSLEAGQLPSPEPGERRRVDERAVPFVEGVCERGQGLQCGDLPFRSPLLTGALDHARVGLDQAVGGGGHQDGSQQPVRLAAVVG